MSRSTEECFSTERMLRLRVPLKRAAVASNMDSVHPVVASDGAWVELCHRQLKPGDYSWGGFYYGIIGIPDHYWIHTSSPDPNCQSIGYGPGGIWHDTGNLGAGSY